MRQCGGFYIKPKKNENESILADAIVETLDGLNFESDNFWAEYFDADKMEVDYETFIDMGDYEHAFVELCKEVAANLPTVAFEGISHYCNESAGFSVDFLIKYDGRKHMKVYTLEYCDGDDFVVSACPDCGKSISVELWDGSLNNIIPTDVWCDCCENTYPIEDVADMTKFKI